MSHLTVARVKKINDKKLFLEELKKINISKMNFEVNEFCLTESELTKEGPKYRVIEKFYLI
jgi:2'-5' RNA ligase